MVRIRFRLEDDDGDIVYDISTRYTSYLPDVLDFFRGCLQVLTFTGIKSVSGFYEDGREASSDESEGI